MGPQRKRQRLDSEDQSGHGQAAKSAERADTKANEEEPKSGKPNNAHRRQLFVRSLPATATNESLTEYFSESYPLKHATVVLDPATKKCKGYGFVTFTDPDDAQRAKEEFDRSLFEGRKIRVELAESRHRDLEAAKDGDTSVAAAALQAKAEREKEKTEARKPPKLIIRNLPWTIKESTELEALFRSYGKVKHATIPKPKFGLMAGFGFVVMRGRKNAERALEAVNGKVVDGRTLAVDWAVEKSVWEETETGPEEADEPTQADALDGIEEVDEDGSEAADEDQHLPVDMEDEYSDSDIDMDKGGGGSMMDEEEEEDEEEDEGGIHLEQGPPRVQDNSSTAFVRNVPFSSNDEMMLEHFAQFGPVRYARVVMDHVTERPRGTAFVCFYNKEDADLCIREAPRTEQSKSQAMTGKGTAANKPLAKHSLLENELSDPSGRYTLGGRILQVSRAVDRQQATKLTEEGHSHRDRRDKDKRRLYLLSEGTIASNSPLYESLAPSEVKMREASLKQRKALIQSNPSLHLSLTRLSIRNVSRSVTSKDLKALAREAVVGFAKDVKAGKRHQLSKEESARGGEEMSAAEKARKARGKGIVKQAKIVFEGQEGGKVSEESGAGRSRGYGFIEYSSHRWALMGLRWLNGHVIAPPKDRKEGKAARQQEVEERKKRLIVEFAIENAQVVARRKEREAKAKDKAARPAKAIEKPEAPKAGSRPFSNKPGHAANGKKGFKRKRDDTDKDAKGKFKNKDKPPSLPPSSSKRKPNQNSDGPASAQSQEIIARKRMSKRVAKKQTRN
ncbi:MAG: hypothetical protein M4579_006714 [Chaenotheca gracillima]|nr:MAG: hypothetical protein M4579_006714 [Chaenotheca gracillima]